MGTLNRGLTNLMLIGCAVSSMTSLPVMADGNGVIVLNRQVQAVPIGRNGGKDPYPTTVNANPSVAVTTAASNAELSDGDFAGVASGSSINRNINQYGTLSGVNSVTNSNGVPGMPGGAAGGGVGSGSSISGTINRAMSTGLAPLGRIAGGQ
ncbi:MULTISPECIES: hypothetical protein [unclassified Pseudomonas]|uniref:hypothetical protein n=1 Tax=unclassified Pseudomonas TaxID=196821 RepID=UPI002AC89B2A|nr:MULTISPECIES: hypothetical protein [unclassified Pseudomonas]MEB0046756.1 hypothetical protein [Pseudomonas sp. Dout3]MEB0097636.1 hypothetical protein [Pseudomonas sp. DC1.2]WPX61283.1 hypothetical protein RHM68_11800 [Pseudomonas sp. DC1.2]